MAKTIKANGLDAFLAELSDDGLRPGEFTSRQAYERHRASGGNRSFNAIRFMLQSKVAAGELTARPIVYMGKVANAYRPA